VYFLLDPGAAACHRGLYLRFDKRGPCKAVSILIPFLPAPTVSPVMLKHALPCLLFLPAVALAECDVVRVEGALNLVVGPNATSCFVGGFRESFLADLHQALAAQQESARAAEAAETAAAAEMEAARAARVQRRPAPNMLAPAPTEPGGRYYGQR
jgi:hypothetical protein